MVLPCSAGLRRRRAVGFRLGADAAASAAAAAAGAASLGAAPFRRRRCGAPARGARRRACAMPLRADAPSRRGFDRLGRRRRPIRGSGAAVAGPAARARFGAWLGTRFDGSCALGGCGTARDCAACGVGRVESSSASAASVSRCGRGRRLGGRLERPMPAAVLRQRFEFGAAATGAAASPVRAAAARGHCRFPAAEWRAAALRGRRAGAHRHVARRCGYGAHDVGLDHHVGRAADHQKVFDIVAPDQDQSAAARRRWRSRSRQGAAGGRAYWRRQAGRHRSGAPPRRSRRSVRARPGMPGRTARRAATPHRTGSRTSGLLPATLRPSIGIPNG